MRRSGRAAVRWLAAVGLLGATLLLAGCGGKDAEESAAPGPEGAAPTDPGAAPADAGAAPADPGMAPPPGPEPGMAPAPEGDPGMPGDMGAPAMGEAPGGAAAATVAVDPTIGPVYPTRSDPFRPLDKPREEPPVAVEQTTITTVFTPMRPYLTAPPRREESGEQARPVPPGLRMTGIFHGPTVRAILVQGEDRSWRVKPGDEVTIEFNGEKTMVVESISPGGVTLKDPQTGEEYLAPYQQ